MNVNEGSFWKSFLAILLGFLTAFILILLIESAGHAIFPIPGDLDPYDATAFAEYIILMPFEEFLPVLFAHFLGVFGGCLVAFKVGEGVKLPVYIVGGIVLLATSMNLYNIPHPLWFMVADILLVLIGILLILRRRV